MIKQILPLAAIAVAVVFAGSAWASDAGTLLKNATQINNSEIQMATLADSKAGDDQALKTFANTLKADHQANEQAVEALLREKNLKLEGTENPGTSSLSNLKGAAFNQAFLTDEVNDHEKAIREFKKARSEMSADPNMELYIEETIPVLEAHLHMAENLKKAETSEGKLARY